MATKPLAVEKMPPSPPGNRLRAPRAPLLWAAGAFASGIVGGTYAWRPPTWWFAAAILFGLVTAFFGRRRPVVAPAIAASVLFASGALMIEVRPAVNPGWDIMRFADGREVTLTGHVTKEGLLRQASFAGVRQIIVAETEEVTSDDGTFPIHAGVRLSFYGKQSEVPAGRLFNYGERLRVTAKLRDARNYRNPGAFDYRSYLAENGIAAVGSAKLNEVEVLPGFAGSKAELWRTKIHRSIIEKIHALWPSNDAALIDAMVIGDDAFIAGDVRTDFQRSGTYHVLVVSGMNVGILAFVTFWVLRRIRLSEFIASAITVLLSIAYALLTDVGPPIWRATLMLTIYLGTRLVYRERSMLNAIGGAALGVLAFEPSALFGASFQLTFLAVLIIGGIAVPLLERTSQPFHRGLRHLESTDYDVTLSPRVAQFRLDLRMIAGRLADLLGQWLPVRMLTASVRLALAAFEIVTVSALMQVGLALPMAFYFHRATVVGLPSNLVVVPLTGVLMPAAVSAVALGYISPVLAKIPAMIAGACVEIMNGSVRWLGHLRVADVRVAIPEMWVMLAAAGALAIAMALARRRFLFSAVGLMLLTVTAAWVALIPPHPQLAAGVMEVTGIDVGQGDSTFLVSPEGKTLLIDAGGPLGGQQSEFDVGEAVVSPYLWSRGISRLDAVMVTHGHSDHIAGMFAVLKNFRPREMWIGAIPENAAFAELLAEARDVGVAVKQLAAGDQFQFGSVDVRVYSPPREWKAGPEPKNNDSLVARFGYRNTAVLIEGDAERQVEREIADQLSPAALLKIAHNGSNTSTTPELLQAVRPQFAFISVGARNTFGHPRGEVLARLARAHVAAYRTDLDGAVTFYLDGSGIKPQAFLH